MLSEVKMNIKDTGGIGGNAYATGVHAKIGVSGVEGAEPILIRATMDAETIREKLGNSPLADAAMDSIEGGARMIWCLPVAAEVSGKISDSVHMGAGKATVTASGTPTNAFKIIVNVTGSGATNEATVVISADGGYSWQDEQTVPISGEITVPNTGIKLKFGASEDETFVEGDTYTFEATAPVASTEGILKACDVFRSFKAEVEYVHVVGITTPAIWRTLEAQAAEMEQGNDGKPIIYICEQRYIGKDETIEDYVEAIKGEARRINGRHVCVVAQYCRYVRMDGREQVVNMAGVFAGKLAGIKESTSAAFVRDVSVSGDKIKQLLPIGIADYLKQMDAERYVMMREYTGKDGYFFANSNTTADASSSFANVENCRVMYRIARAVYRRALDHQNRDFDQTNMEVALREVQEDLNVPIDDAVRDQIISSGAVELLFDEMTGGNDKTLPVRISYISRGYLRKLELSFAVVNSLM